MQHLVDGWFQALKLGSLILVIAAVVFTGLEENFSFRRLRKPWRTTLLDLQFFFTNLLLPPLINFGFTALLAFFVVNPRLQYLKPAPLLFAAELFIVLFAFDTWTYLRHRCFHSKKLWPIHSIHHSSEDLNWISGQRNHPAEVSIDVVGELIVFTLFKWAGVYPGVILVAGIVIGVWNFFVHSNTRWTFGPLRYFITSPMLHRWHHSDSPEAADKNFAVMFSCIDVLLGTFYMPKNQQPKTTGLFASEKKGFPRTLLGQIIHPFISRSR